MTASVLDSQLCAAVYKTAHAFTAAYRRLLEPHGLTYPQYLVLLALWENECLTVKQLGAKVDLDSGTLSPLLTRLENAGHLMKTRSATDARVVEVTLTVRGQRLHDELREVPQQIAGCAGVSRTQAKTLLDELHALTESLRQAT